MPATLNLWQNDNLITIDYRLQSSNYKLQTCIPVLFAVVEVRTGLPVAGSAIKLISH